MRSTTILVAGGGRSSLSSPQSPIESTTAQQPSIKSNKTWWLVVADRPCAHRSCDGRVRPAAAVDSLRSGVLPAVANSHSCRQNGSCRAASSRSSRQQQQQQQRCTDPDRALYGRSVGRSNQGGRFTYRCDGCTVKPGFLHTRYVNISTDGWLFEGQDGKSPLKGFR